MTCLSFDVRESLELGNLEDNHMKITIDNSDIPLTKCRDSQPNSDGLNVFDVVSTSSRNVQYKKFTGMILCYSPNLSRRAGLSLRQHVPNGTPVPSLNGFLYLLLRQPFEIHQIGACEIGLTGHDARFHKERLEAKFVRVLRLLSKLWEEVVLVVPNWCITDYPGVHVDTCRVDKNAFRCLS